MVEIQDVAKPTAGPGDVLLQIQTAAVCGSDIHGFLGHSERRKPGLVLGHRAPSKNRSPYTVELRAKHYAVGRASICDDSHSQPAQVWLLFLGERRCRNPRFARAISCRA